MNSYWGIVVGNAVVATVLALVALPLGRIWKNAAAVHLLWVVVLLKLFTPPILTAEVPVAWTRVPSSTGVGSADREANRFTPAEVGAFTPAAAPGPGARGVISQEPEDRSEDQPEAAPDCGPWPLAPILGVVWLGGSGALALVAAVRLRRFAVGLRDAEPAPSDLRAMVAELSGRLGLRRDPVVLMTTRALPPLVWSLGTRPRLVIPAELFAGLGRDAQRTILAHELIHIRRGDHRVRLLELAAQVVFWWHPVVWVASRHLRDLEEVCCDGRVLELLPDQPRTYATALVATLEFLAGRTGPPVPLRTAIESSHSLSRRIVMLTQRRPNRLTTLSALLVAGLVTLPLIGAVAISPEPTRQAASEVPQPADAPPTVLRGRVTDKAGAPLAGARVRVAVPAADMRFAETGTGEPNRTPAPKLRETRTDAQGDYRLELPGITERTAITIDVLKPGYRRLVGTLMQGGDARRIEVEAGQEVEAWLELEPARYYRGVVVDEQGRPIPAVQVGANVAFDGASGGVESTVSGPDGVFELFNYPVEPFKLGKEPNRELVHLMHPDYIGTRIENLTATEPDQRTNLRITLATGRRVTGVVVDATGQPVRNALVEVESPAQGGRKATRTDAGGKFALQGLNDGKSVLKARSLEVKQKASQTLTLNGDKLGQEVRLQPMVLPANSKKTTVLGMQLVDVTPELQSVYDLYFPQGALILDPGQNSDRLAIGQIAEGYAFWQVGDKGRVGGVRDFVNQVLAGAAGQADDRVSVRVVYRFKTPEAVGNNTQYLKLTPDDLKDLRAVADRLAAEAQ